MTMLITSAFYMLTIVVGIFCLRSLRKFERSVQTLRDQVESLDNLLALNFEALKDRIEENWKEHEALSDIFSGHLANDFKEVQNKVIKTNAVTEWQQQQVNEFVLKNMREYIEGLGYVDEYSIDDKITESCHDNANHIIKNIVSKLTSE